MPRIRSVHPELCTDELLAQMDDPSAERTFVRLWTQLDDEGRAIDNPKLLKAALYPLHDSMTTKKVDRDLDVLAKFGLIRRYEVAGKHYLCAKPEAWGRFQKPRHPALSKLPAFDETCGSPAADGRNGTAEGGTTHAGEERRGVGDGERAGRNGAAERGLVFNAIANACEWPVDELTRPAREKLQLATRDLADVEPQKIARFPAWWKRTYPGLKLTPQAIAAHWTAFLGDRNGGRPPPPPTKSLDCTNPDCMGGWVLDEDDGTVSRCESCESAKEPAA